MERRIIATLFLVFLFAQLHAQKSKKVKLPQHQIILSFTNAATGFTKDDYSAFSIVANNEIRYGLVSGIEYNAKLLRWLSLGTGLAFILHRSFSSKYSLLTSPPPIFNNFLPKFKNKEGILSKGIIDLPAKIIFSFFEKNKLEFQFETGISFQFILFNKEESHVTDYTGFTYRMSRRLVFPGESGIGFVIGPILKIGKTKGLMLQPEFRLIQLINFNNYYGHMNAKAYSAGLKIGWFFIHK